MENVSRKNEAKKCDFFSSVKWRKCPEKKKKQPRQREGLGDDVSISSSLKRKLLFSGLPSDVLPVASDSLKWRQRCWQLCPACDLSNCSNPCSLSCGIKPKEDVNGALNTIRNHLNMSEYLRETKAEHLEAPWAVRYISFLQIMRLIGLPWMVRGEMDLVQEHITMHGSRWNAGENENYPF